MAAAWKDIKSRDVLFNYTYPDGSSRIVSLAEEILADVILRLTGETYGPASNKSEYPRGVVRDAVRAWFAGAYCYSDETRYNLSKLEQRIRYLCKDPEARKMGFSAELPFMSSDDKALERGIQLAFFLDYHFYAPDSIPRWRDNTRGDGHVTEHVIVMWAEANDLKSLVNASKSSGDIVRGVLADPKYADLCARYYSALTFFLSYKFLLAKCLEIDPNVRLEFENGVLVIHSNTNLPAEITGPYFLAFTSETGMGIMVQQQPMAQSGYYDELDERSRALVDTYVYEIGGEVAVTRDALAAAGLGEINDTELVERTHERANIGFARFLIGNLKGNVQRKSLSGSAVETQRPRKPGEKPSGNPAFLLDAIASSELANRPSFTLKELEPVYLRFCAAKGVEPVKDIDTLREDLHRKKDSLKAQGYLVLIRNKSGKYEYKVTMKLRAKAALEAARKNPDELLNAQDTAGGPNKIGIDLYNLARNAAEQNYILALSVSSRSIRPLHLARKNIAELEKKFTRLLLTIRDPEVFDRAKGFFKSAQISLPWSFGYYDIFLWQIELRRRRDRKCRGGNTGGCNCRSAA